MEIASFIISIIGTVFSIAGIIISLWCWRHTWKEIQLFKQMRTNDFSKEGDFQKFVKNAMEYQKESNNTPFDFNGNFHNDTQTALFNLAAFLNKK